MKVFVADTGPILHLHQIGALECLRHLGKVSTTPQVAQEVHVLAPKLAGQGWPGWLIVEEPSAVASREANAWVWAGLVDAGEAEALAHARQARPDCFLTDDTEARELAGILGLEARGTLGIILTVTTRGFLDHSAALKLLDKLEQDSTLWLSARVKRTAREALEKIFKPRI